MIPTDKPTGAIRVLPLLALLALALPACVYRPNIQQGNLLETTDVDQVTVGMTRSQVRYLLGTPMVSDPFDAQRWDYVYTFQQGRSRTMDRAHFVVYFEGDKVSRVERLGSPAESGAQQRTKQADAEQEKNGTAEPAAPPVEAPRPAEATSPTTPPPDPSPPAG